MVAQAVHAHFGERRDFVTSTDAPLPTITGIFARASGQCPSGGGQCREITGRQAYEVGTWSNHVGVGEIVATG
ncbi:hypothetical protein D9M71_745500 [compost metagenome]